MIEFEGMEDWDLQAVVRGCTSEFATAIMEDNNNSQCSSFDLLYGFSDCCFEKNKSVLDELDEFYKPFYPQAAIKEHPVAAGLSTVGATSIVGAAIPKRRKNQHKRVVKQVTADDLSSDTWAWRKYGQKPIKGSPYPRSYYRCSSSKGCLARKQVERSSSDPTMFTISYTVEHSHSHPVRRNSLAGIAKKKYNTMKKPSNSDPKTTPTLKDSSCCSPISSTNVFSPTSPLMACLEDEFPQHESNISMVSNNVLHSGFEGLDHGLTTADMSAFECWFSDQIPATFQS